MTSQISDCIKFQDNHYLVGENEYPIKYYLDSIAFDIADFDRYPPNLDNYLAKGFVHISTSSNCCRGYVAI